MSVRQFVSQLSSASIKLHVKFIELMLNNSIFVVSLRVVLLLTEGV